MINQIEISIIENQQSKKLRGGYYTPKAITQFISNWALQNKNDSVLEPSCGDGEFIESVIERFIQLGAKSAEIANNVSAVEYNDVEAAKAKQRFINHKINFKKTQFFVGDFFNYCKHHLTDKIQFDCIVGNPPFIRYQDFPEEQRIPAFSLMKRAGLNPNKLINTWIPFLVSSTLLLKNGGRIGMVIPAELFQVNYSAETRQFLSESYSKITLITFKKLVFDNIQQEIVLFLGEKNNYQKHGINVIEANDVNDLNKINLTNFNNNIKVLNHSTDKWTQYFLNNNEIELLRKLKSDPTLPLSGEYIDVDVGIVTGQNKFFVMSQNDIKKYKLSEHVIRIMGKSNHLKGIIVSEDDWNDLVESQSPNFMLNAPNIDYTELPIELRKYIDYGVSEKYNVGYKCKIRKRWWSIPSIWTPDAFMLRQVHCYPKIILNKCKATATDTLHRIKFINGVKGEVLATAFLNSLTFAFSEVTGRSYGGGVLTFEPSEAEKLPLPIKNANKLDIKMIDKLLRNKDIESVLDITDDILLHKGFNLSKKDIKTLRTIWKKLRDRRINRRK